MTDKTRWVKSLKYKIVSDIRSGEMTFDDTIKKYNMSEEELKSWMDRADAHGVDGLRATRVQEYRAMEAV